MEKAKKQRLESVSALRHYTKIMPCLLKVCGGLSVRMTRPTGVDEATGLMVNAIIQIQTCGQPFNVKNTEKVGLKAFLRSVKKKQTY
jgi:hypothetical protein